MVVAAVALVGCGGARGKVGRQIAPDAGPAVAWSDDAPAGDLVAAPYGVPGEQLIYHIKFRGVRIGRFRVAVGRPGRIAGKRVVIVRSVVESSGLLAIVRDLWWRLETTVDLDGGYPIRSVSELSAVVDGRQENERRERDWRYSKALHNLHSAVGALRGWSPKLGDKVGMRLTVGGSFRIELMLAAREYAAWAGAPTLRIEGKTRLGRGFRFTVWVTDDAARLPLKLTTETAWGEMSVELVSYRADAARLRL
jgi:hypothetical protein